jgi:hypothetical protein
MQGAYKKASIGAIGAPKSGRKFRDEEGEA